MAANWCIQSEKITDYSFIFLNNVTLAFNSCDFSIYIETIKVSQNNDRINTVKCILKDGIAHLIKSVCQSILKTSINESRTFSFNPMAF